MHAPTAWPCSCALRSALARKNGYKLQYNREIVGLGLANFFGAAFGCYTTTGSFSRSALNNEAGALHALAWEYVMASLSVTCTALMVTAVSVIFPRWSAASLQGLWPPAWASRRSWCSGAHVCTLGPVIPCFLAGGCAN